MGSHDLIGLDPFSNRCRELGIAAVLMLAMLVVFPTSAAAQIGRDSIPSTVYYRSFPILYDGDYRAALGNFSGEVQGGIKTVQSAWIDSICYHTMTGECYYHMGKLPQALDHYTRALNLLSAFHNWMLSVTFPPFIQPGPVGSRKAVPWGQSRRGTEIGSFPSAFQMQQGKLNNNDVVQRGGVVQAPVIVSVNVDEIVRASCLAMRRRRELLGPMAKHDPLTAEIVTKLSQRPGQLNNWSIAWVDVQLGAAYASMGNMAQAVASLENSLIVGGRYDHPLTGTALLELGRIALEAGDVAASSRYFDEATYCAVNFGDTGLLEEAFRLGQLANRLANAKQIYPPLATAVAWAKANGSRMLHASLSIMAAEDLASLGQTPAANNMLAEAKRSLQGADMSQADVGARFQMATATVSYQLGKVGDGDTAIASAMKYQSGGSLWLFQINLADTNYTGGNPAFSDRVGPLMYEILLRDPTPADWLSSPLESLSVMTNSHPGPYEHWFEAVQARRNEPELALEISDKARRHRFYSTLPMGGRLLALRWLLEGPTELLTQRATLQKQDLLSRYSKYATLAEDARRLRTELSRQPVADDNNDARKEQSTKLSQLGAIGQQQEVILREMAVRHEPCDLVFPPIRKTKDLQNALQPGHALLSFFSTTRATYGFLFTREKYTSWRIVNPNAVKGQIAGLLRELGQFEQNHPLSVQELQSSGWQKAGAKVLELLFDKSSVDLSAKFEELIIVPDALLWYLPFELLPVVARNEGETLLSRVKVRYAPTVGLAIPYTRSRKPQYNVGVVTGKLFPQDDLSVTRTAYEQIARAVPGALALPFTLPAASGVYRTVWDEIILLDDIENSDGGPYDWSPAQIDRGKPGSTLASWFPLPWGAPERMILPGFHTAAENGLKKGSANGNELFLSLCGLMSTGARTVLISRWRTAGQTSLDLVREFAQELPSTSPADAWQRAVQIAAATPLDQEAEPRLKKLPPDAQPTASHPFFWAGYLLVDSGVLPEGAQPPPPEAAPLKPPANAAVNAAPPVNGAAAVNPMPVANGAQPPAIGVAPGVNDAPVANPTVPPKTAPAKAPARKK